MRRSLLERGSTKRPSSQRYPPAGRTSACGRPVPLDATGNLDPFRTLRLPKPIALSGKADGGLFETEFRQSILSGLLNRANAVASIECASGDAPWVIGWAILRPLAYHPAADLVVAL